MRKLLALLVISLLASCANSEIDDQSSYFIDYAGYRFINNSKIAFDLTYNIPSGDFKKDTFFIISWNKIGSKSIWNGFLTDTLTSISGNAEEIVDLAKIKSNITANDTLMFHFSLESRESEFKTVQITKSSVIIFTSK